MANTGGINNSDIESLFGEEEISSEFGASDVARFSQKAAALIRKWFDQTTGERAGFSIFVYHESVRAEAEEQEYQSMPFLAAGNDAIIGKAFLCDCSLNDPHLMADQIGMADEAIAALKSSGYGDCPAIIADWRGDEPFCRLYPKGVHNADTALQMFVLAKSISEQEMEKVLEVFYETSLKYPRACSEGGNNKIWKDTAKRIPVKRTEAVIQARLLEQLKAIFSVGFLVRQEQDNEMGRADIQIHQDISSGCRVCEWVLELKVLRENTSGGNKVSKANISEAVQDGYEQAMLYAEKENALQKALSCYDMRKTDEGQQCFANVSTDAANNNVVLWQWYLHNSDKENRKSEIKKRTKA